MKDRAEPQSIPLGAQLKSLCDWHKALVALSFTPLTFHLKAFSPNVNTWVSVMLTLLLLQVTFMS